MESFGSELGSSVKELGLSLDNWKLLLLDRIVAEPEVVVSSLVRFGDLVNDITIKFLSEHTVGENIELDGRGMHIFRELTRGINFVVVSLTRLESLNNSLIYKFVDSGSTVEGK